MSATGIRGVQHVALEVDDLAAALRFYVDGLGFAVLDRPASLGDGGAWLAMPGGVALHLVETPTFVAPSTSQHLALETANLDACIAELQDRGVCDIGEPFDVGAGLQAFLRDPAGNLLELNQPNSTH